MTQADDDLRDRLRRALPVAMKARPHGRHGAAVGAGGDRQRRGLQPGRRAGGGYVRP